MTSSSAGGVSAAGGDPTGLAVCTYFPIKRYQHTGNAEEESASGEHGTNHYLPSNNDTAELSVALTRLGRKFGTSAPLLQ